MLKIIRRNWKKSESEGCSEPELLCLSSYCSKLCLCYRSISNLAEALSTGRWGKDRREGVCGQWRCVCEIMYSGGCFGICWCLWYWVTTAGGGSPVKWWCVAPRYWNLSLQGNLSKEHNTTTGKCCRQFTSSCCWFSALPVSRSGTRLAQCWSLWTRWPIETLSFDIWS